MKKKGIFGITTDKLKGIKNIEIVFAILIFAVILSIFSTSLTKPNETVPEDIQLSENDSDEIEEVITYDNDQEKRLQQILSTIKGAGKVEVMITYKSGKEIVPAINITQSTTNTQERDREGGTRTVTQEDENNQPVIMGANDGSKPLIIKEYEPEIKGVLIIAEGAEDIMVQLELQRAVQTALGIKANQVEVFPMDSNNIKE